MSDLTPAQVAEALSLPSTESVLRLLRAGTLPGYRVGRYWRVDPDELAEWKAGPARPADPNRIAPRSRQGNANLSRTRRAS